MANELTHKQELYCIHYVEYGNKSDAYRYAYDTSKMKDATVNRSAHELHKDHKITARIDELRKELFESLNINIVSIASSFKEIRDRAMQKEPVKDLEGNNIGEWKHDSNAAIKANENLAKLVGAFEKHNSQKVKQPSMSEEEILAEIKRLDSIGKSKDI